VLWQLVYIVLLVDLVPDGICSLIAIQHEWVYLVLVYILTCGLYFENWHIFWLLSYVLHLTFILTPGYIMMTLGLHICTLPIIWHLAYILTLEHWFGTSCILLHLAYILTLGLHFDTWPILWHLAYILTLAYVLTLGLHFDTWPPSWHLANILTLDICFDHWSIFLQLV